MRKEYITEDGKFDFEKYNSLTEEQQFEEAQTWNGEQRRAYFCPEGTITLEQFGQKLYESIKKIQIEKYGSNR